MVEDFCADCVEPAPGAACEKQDAGPALDGQNGAGSSGYERYISGLLIRVAPPDSVWSLSVWRGRRFFCFGGELLSCEIKMLREDRRVCGG